MSLENLLVTQNDQIDDDKKLIVERLDNLQKAIQAEINKPNVEAPLPTEDLLKTVGDNQNQAT